MPNPGLKIKPGLYFNASCFPSCKHWLNPNRLPPTACPSCRKPLPRCSVCLLHLGSGQTAAPAPDALAQRFDVWFTWCQVQKKWSLRFLGSFRVNLFSFSFLVTQTCRHGGHSKHMSDWFAAYEKCPVAGCECRCNSLR